MPRLRLGCAIRDSPVCSCSSRIEAPASCCDAVQTLQGSNERTTRQLSALQEELAAVPALLAMLDSPVAALRAKALVSFALLAQTHLSLLLLAFQAKLSPQVSLMT